MKDKVIRIIKIFFFLFCLFLVIYGQKTVGRAELFIQLFGLSGLLFLLWNYNRKFI
ncbi:hypothetical protein BN1058_01543 [Paraliobacillus sp. PM-2]|uniref:DUF6903 family protein n=1 Tax=Paraliobacillus sp. PM-2 TaxID=1462524 RepID=UPI00061C8BB6|nr:hypothetical protein [Paraliobacillus sp. PM-2]CQR47236.1 hypothetical protein BN1058_01543 [Paraliobacillus sp. PM-2]